MSTSAAEGDQNSALQVNKGTAKPFRGRCYACNQEGHKSYECPKKLAKPSKGPVNKHCRMLHRAKTVNEDGTCNQSSESESELFLSATGQTENEKRQYWIIDSGAENGDVFWRHTACGGKLVNSK